MTATLSHHTVDPLVRTSTGTHGAARRLQKQAGGSRTAPEEQGCGGQKGRFEAAVAGSACGEGVGGEYCNVAGVSQSDAGAAQHVAEYNGLLARKHAGSGGATAVAAERAVKRDKGTGALAALRLKHRVCGKENDACLVAHVCNNADADISKQEAALQRALSDASGVRGQGNTVRESFNVDAHSGTTAACGV